jgi:methylmalonyl-CoA/ethylmalonyl-CoA epimerase
MLELPILKRLDHVGVAAASWDNAREILLNQLGMELDGARTSLPDGNYFKPENVTIFFIKVGLGETRVEVLIPRDEVSGTAKFLMRRGPGLHHLGYAVESVAKAAADLRSRGIAQIDLRDGGANENNAAFFVPKDCMGILTELVPDQGPSLPRG